MNIFRAAKRSSLHFSAKILPCWWPSIHFVYSIFHLQDACWEKSSAETTRALPASISWRCGSPQTMQLGTFGFSATPVWRITQSQWHQGKERWMERGLKGFGFSFSRQGESPFGFIKSSHLLKLLKCCRACWKMKKNKKVKAKAEAKVCNNQ